MYAIDVVMEKITQRKGGEMGETKKAEIDRESEGEKKTKAETSMRPRSLVHGGGGTKGQSSPSIPQSDEKSCR
jgi:hypothetical protein